MGIVTGYLSQLVSSGIKLLVGGSAVSSSNPLPVQNANAAPTDRSSKTSQARVCGEVSQVRLHQAPLARLK